MQLTPARYLLCLRFHYWSVPSSAELSIRLPPGDGSFFSSKDRGLKLPVDTKVCSSVPAIVPAILVIAICIPNNFPYHGQTQQASRYSSFLSTHALKRVDFVGAAMLLVATLFLVAALQEAGLDYQWNSGFVIALLTISGVTWIAFLVWERRTTMAATKREPVFPWRFIQNRVWLGMLLYVPTSYCVVFVRV